MHSNRRNPSRKARNPPAVEDPSELVRSTSDPPCEDRSKKGVVLQSLLTVVSKHDFFDRMQEAIANPESLIASQMLFDIGIISNAHKTLLFPQTSTKSRPMFAATDSHFHGINGTESAEACSSSGISTSDEEDSFVAESTEACSSGGISTSDEEDSFVVSDDASSDGSDSYNKHSDEEG